MGGLLKKLFYFVIAVVALFAVATIAISLFFDPNDYRDDIVAKVKETTGRDLAIEGEISLTFFPWIGADVGAVEGERYLRTAVDVGAEGWAESSPARTSSSAPSSRLSAPPAAAASTACSSSEPMPMYWQRASRLTISQRSPSM